MIRRPLGALGVAVAVLTLTSVAAASSTSVVTVVKSQSRALAHSPAAREIAHFHPTTRARIAEGRDAFNRYAVQFDRAATVVSRARADGTRQRAGRRDWVRAAHTAGRGLRRFAAALTDLLHGRTASAKAEIAAAKRIASVASRFGHRADRLLRIRPSAA